MFVLERLISVIAPHSCLVCGQEGSLICADCASDATIRLPSRCYVCKMVTNNFAVCERCKPKSRLRHVWVSAEYNGLAKGLIQFYKFERGQAGAKVIAGQMAENVSLLNGRPLLVPVPTATSRLRARGYDHTKLLAREIARLTGLHYQGLVGRLGQSRQVGARREDRLKQLDSAFYVKRPELINGESIILIDDVVTTGGTLESIAKALRRAGAKSVNAVVFAQKSWFCLLTSGCYNHLC